MLFGLCDCITRPSSISRRGLLCAGGAGFVSAMVGTLIGNGRSAQAQVLRGAVPQVDRLSVRIVSDIIVRRYATSQKLNGLTVERMQGNETPESPPRATLVGEWGLSMHAESQRGNEVRNISGAPVKLKGPQMRLR